MKKRFLMAIAFFALVATVLVTAVFATEIIDSGTCGANLTWELDSYGVLTISGTGAMDNYSDTENPWRSHRSSIKTVVISVGVTSIGDFAFNSCENLINFTIPNSVISIGKYAFCGCNFISLTIPDNVTSIGDSAFASCQNLESVTIGAGVTTINDYLFAYNSNFKSVTIPINVTSIKRSAFTRVAKDFVIYGSEGSTAEMFATENCFVFVALDDVSEPKISFTITSTIAKPSETINLSLNVSSEVESNSIILYELTYDSDILTFVGFTDTEPMTEKCILSAFDSENTRTITLALETSEVLVGEICKLRFTVNENATDCMTAVSMTSLVKCDATEIASEVNEATVTIRTYTLGDINMDEIADVRDALLLFQYSMLPDIFPISYRGNIDFNNDDSIDLRDALKLFQYSMFPEMYPL